MTTLITHQKSDGTLIGRCDAKCHNAQGAICTCVCGSINHGVGNNQAIENTREHGALLNEAQDAGEFIINQAQYKLFPGKPANPKGGDANDKD